MTVPAPTRTFVLTLLLVFLAAAGAVAQDTPAGKQPPKAPPGVTVEVVSGGEQPQPAAPQPPVIVPPPAPGAKAQDEPKIKLTYEGLPFGQILDDLKERLHVLILCDDEKLLQVKVYAHSEIRESFALLVMCARVLHLPKAGYVLCGKRDVLAGRLVPKAPLKPNPVVNIKLQDAVLGDAARYITEVTDVGFGVIPELAHTKVTYEAQNIALDKAAEQIAERVGCAQTTGFLVVPRKKLVDDAFAMLEKMSDADLNRTMREGMAAGRKAMASGDLPGAPTGQADFQDGMQTFEGLDPELKAQMVQEAVGTVTRAANLIGRLEPDTRADLKQMVQPFIGLAIAGYIGLPAKTRAELAPIMQALNKIKW